MSNAKSKQAKPKTGLARCMELASDRKGLVFLAAVLSSLAAIASFIPYIAVYFILDMTAALSTPAALVVHTVFGMNGHYYCFLIIHDNPPKKGPWREIRHGPKHIGQALLSRYLLTTALRARGQTHHRERVAGRQRKRGH